MSAIIWFWVILVLSCIASTGVVMLAMFTAYNFRDIKDKLSALAKQDPEPVAVVVTPLPPGYADVNKSSSVITPKSPAQIDREEEQRIRDLR